MQKSKTLPIKAFDKGIYYGWIILFFGTLGVIASVPGQTMGVSVYTEHLMAALNIDRSSLSLAYLFGTLASALFLPKAGKILDKVGSRIFSTVACILLAFFLSALAFTPQITAMVNNSFPALSKFSAFTFALISFLGIRHFGQGQLTMSSRTMMGRWFEKKRGLVLGISGIFVAFGFGVAPQVLNFLINISGWRNSLFILSGCILLMAVLAYTFFRSSPEECGLEIDGGMRNIPDVGNHENQKVEFSLTSSEAIRTAAFWIFNLGMVNQAMLMTAVTFHISDIGNLHGLSNAKAFGLFLPVAVVSVIADLSGGYLSDKLNIKYVLAFMQLGLATGLLAMTQFGTSGGFYLAALGMGISNGLFSLLMGVAWPRLFGRKHLGSIAGLNMSSVVLGSALGPFLFSLGKDLSGSYSSIMMILATLPVLVIISALVLKDPKREDLR